MLELSDLQKEAVKEILNIAIGHAAASLNRLVHEQVMLSVPQLVFARRTEAIALIDAHAGDAAGAVGQSFTGPFAGDVMLIFPRDKSLELARSLVGDVVPLDDMTELEQEALTEAGNIVLNACLGTLANVLDLELDSSLPRYVQGSGRDVLHDDGEDDSQALAMFVEVTFDLRERNIGGYVLFVLDVRTVERFIGLIDDYVAKVTT